jgi:hypothetical protein
MDTRRPPRHREAASWLSHERHTPPLTREELAAASTPMNRGTRRPLHDLPRCAATELRDAPPP